MPLRKRKQTGPAEGARAGPAVGAGRRARKARAPPAPSVCARDLERAGTRRRRRSSRPPRGSRARRLAAGAPLCPCSTSGARICKA